MRKSACALLLLSLFSGCVSTDGSGACNGCYGTARAPVAVPGMQGPYGQPVPMIQPYASARPGQQAAMAMLASSIPLDKVQIHGSGMQQSSATGGSDVMLASAQMADCPPGGCLPAMHGPQGGMISPPGVPFAPGMPAGGPMVPFGVQPPPGAVAAAGANTGHPNNMQYASSRTQIRFVRPAGMKVAWFTRTPDGRESFSQTPIEVPGRYNFPQGAIYRLRLSDLPGRPGLVVYPTLDVWPATKATEAFLSHSAVPVAFTDEDFRQVAAGNYVVKVVYLPAPEYQDLAFTGPDEIVSTQLEPGADPILEAQRRGHILLVIRMGNMDQEAPNTPPINAPGAGMVPPHTMAPNMVGRMPNMMPPGMIPPGMAPRMATSPTSAYPLPYPPVPPMPGMNPQIPSMPQKSAAPTGPISQAPAASDRVTPASLTSLPSTSASRETQRAGLFRGGLLQSLGLSRSSSSGN